MAPSSAGDTATLSGRDGLAHYAVVLALGALVVEARLFERAAGGAVEERGRDLLARRVLRVGLHDSAACLRDQVQSPLDRDGGHPVVPVIAVHEDAGEAIVGRGFKAGFVFLLVEDARELCWRPVLTPANRDAAVENEGGVRSSLTDQELLVRPSGLNVGIEAQVLAARMKPRAPALAEPHSVVFLAQSGEGVPGLGAERLDRVFAHSTPVYWWVTRCCKAVNEAAVSRRIRGASSRSSGPDPPCTSALFTSRTHPGPAGSSRWLKVTVPSGTGHSVTQRRPGSTTVTVKAPPRLPRCLAQPRAPGSNGPSSWATSLLTSHSGQRATSVHTFQTASGSASKTASYSNRYMIISAGAAHGFTPQPNESE